MHQLSFLTLSSPPCSVPSQPSFPLFSCFYTLSLCSLLALSCSLCLVSLASLCSTVSKNCTYAFLALACSLHLECYLACLSSSVSLTYCWLLKTSLFFQFLKKKTATVCNACGHMHVNQTLFLLVKHHFFSMYSLIWGLLGLAPIKLQLKL